MKKKRGVLIGRHYILAITYRLAEVVVQRSKLFDRMGFTHRGRTYLYIEEALYLLDRGDMLLVVELDKTMGRPLTMAEGLELMDHCGVPMSAFRIYGHLRRAGYAVTRYPACWIASGTDVLPVARWGVACRPVEGGTRTKAPGGRGGNKRGAKAPPSGVEAAQDRYGGVHMHVGCG